MDFAEQDVNSAKGIDVYSEEEMIMIQIRETKTRLVMQVELEECRK